MKTLCSILPLIVSVSTLAAAEPIPNSLIDYQRFQKIVVKSAKPREAARLTEKQFLAAMAEKDTVLLDARSTDKYALRHIKEAVNLPFTDFTEETLKKVLPSKTTKILIYCNNNFRGDQAAFASKSAPASLNLSTQISLRAYGYTNIYELGPLLEVGKTAIPFDGSQIYEEARP
ncbi:MAG: rhodanese-like domain-containing protein [Chthoniobacterales bacterium]